MRRLHRSFTFGSTPDLSCCLPAIMHMAGVIQSDAPLNTNTSGPYWSNSILWRSAA